MKRKRQLVKYNIWGQHEKPTIFERILHWMLKK